MKILNIKFLEHIGMLLLCCAFIAGVSLKRDNKILNIDLNEKINHKQTNNTSQNTFSEETINKIPPLNSNILKEFDILNTKIVSNQPGVWLISSNHYIISTYPYNIKTYGYAGHTPLFIELKDNKINKIVADKNNETPGFWNSAINTKILNKWDGLSLKEVTDYHVDAISGATYSSNSIIENVENTARNFSGLKAPSIWIKIITLKNAACLIVLLIGLLFTFFAKGKIYRLIRLILNVVVLGFWCGQTLSLSSFINSMSNGINFANNSILFCLLLVAIILPFFGKKRYYCNQVCPFGSAQELMNKIPIKNKKIDFKIIHILNYLRYTILGIIIIIMWTGISFNIINYEPFSAFIFQTANTAVLIIAILFLLISIIIPKPYCRFICPTGALISMSDNSAK